MYSESPTPNNIGSPSAELTLSFTETYLNEAKDELSALAQHLEAYSIIQDKQLAPTQNCLGICPYKHATCIMCHDASSCLFRLYDKLMLLQKYVLQICLAQVKGSWEVDFWNPGHISCFVPMQNDSSNDGYDGIYCDIYKNTIDGRVSYRASVNAPQHSYKESIFNTLADALLWVSQNQ